MPRVEFEPTIPVFKRAKTVHALDLAATVIGRKRHTASMKQWNLLIRGTRGA
jgi:hypothetical protein